MSSPSWLSDAGQPGCGEASRPAYQQSKSCWTEAMAGLSILLMSLLSRHHCGNLTDQELEIIAAGGQLMAPADEKSEKTIKENQWAQSSLLDCSIGNSGRVFHP